MKRLTIVTFLFMFYGVSVSAEHFLEGRYNEISFDRCLEVFKSGKMLGQVADTRKNRLMTYWVLVLEGDNYQFFRTLSKGDGLVCWMLSDLKQNKHD